MAWSLHPTTYPSNYAASQIRAFMRAYMNGKGDPNSAKGGWTCGRAGHSVEFDTTCLFTYIGADGVKRYSQFSIDSGSTGEALVANTEINSAFDPTSTDPDVVATYPFVPSVDSNSLPEDDISNSQIQSGAFNINFWVSDENPTAWIGIVNGCAVYSFLPVEQINIAPCGPKTGTSPEESGYVDYMMLLPQCDGKGATFCGPPLSLVNDDTVLASYFPTVPGRSTVIQRESAVYKGVTLQQYNTTIAKLTDDILYNMPAGTPWGSSYMYTCYNTNSLTSATKVQPAFDGTKYWLYLGGAAGAGPEVQCWVLDLGDTPYSVIT